MWQVKIGHPESDYNNMTILESSHCLVASGKHYFPIHDLKRICFPESSDKTKNSIILPSQKRWHWARGEQVWYDLRLNDETKGVSKTGQKNPKILKEFAYVYPEPTTHRHVKNCITFVRGVKVRKIEG